MINKGELKKLYYEALIDFEKTTPMNDAQWLFLKLHKDDFNIFKSFKVNDEIINNLPEEHYIVLIVKYKNNVVMSINYTNIETDTLILQSVVEFFNKFDIHVKPTIEDLKKHSITLEGFKPSYYYLPFNIFK